MAMTIRQLKDYIKADESLQAIYNHVKASLEHDPGHDMAHFLRVAIMAIDFANGQCDQRCLVAAALLHDVVNLPKDHPESQKASSLSAGVARDLLPQLGFTSAEVEDIACAVRDHSYSRGAKPVSLLGEVIQDADRMEALGVLGVLRNIAVGTQMGSIFFHPHDPWALERDLNDKKYCIDHFFIKLFKIPEKMNTLVAQKMAQERCHYMAEMLGHLGCEIGHPWSPKNA